MLSHRWRTVLQESGANSGSAPVLGSMVNVQNLDVLVVDRIHNDVWSGVSANSLVAINMAGACLEQGGFLKSAATRLVNRPHSLFRRSADRSVANIP